MTAKNIILATLPLLVTCKDGTQAPALPFEAQQKALGKVPPTEVATWHQVGLGSSPKGRFLQATAWDEKRGVIVMFGGETPNPSSALPPCNQDMWEWSPTTGNWTNRTGPGVTPGARAGAALVYDSAEEVFVLFGGRTTSGVNYEDTWEWNPSSGAWTDRTSAGPHPSARTQHGMVYEKSSGKILLFGGGTSSTATNDGTSVSTSLKDTWEYAPVAHSWADRSPASGPDARHDFGLVWDSSRNRAILVGGMQVDPAVATHVYKQDTWEWDPTGAGTWTDRTASGTNPSPRHAHAMAYDGTRKRVVLFGGSDDNTAGKNDLWDWDPNSSEWSQRLSGSESGLPSARIYASLVSDNNSHLELVAGEFAASLPGTKVGGLTGSNEVWELAPATPAFTNRTPPQDLPAPRTEHAMAYNPATGKVYMFGGRGDQSSQASLNDFWEWDGKAWTQVVTSNGPAAAYGAALAYDPVRKSLILYGGVDDLIMYGETWEWNGTNRQWAKLETTGNPGPVYLHGMVTDTVRGRILLFGSGSASGHVWDWDGGSLTWTDRSPLSLSTMALGRSNPIMAYDEGRQRMFLYDGMAYDYRYPQSASAFWQWDPATAGWTRRDPGESLSVGYTFAATYDPLRRRIVMYTDAPNANSQETWELDAKTSTWYVRTLATAPSRRSGPGFTFDIGRGVAVMFGGSLGGGPSNETWEYRVTNLGNGEGCTAASASTCASGNCVDGICCAAASCTGTCQSCNVPGLEGACKLAQAGMEVPGSCDNGQACDGTGACKSKNGQACTGNGTCASGFCADGVCCDSACTGTCVSCNLSGRAGQCSPHPVGTDPDSDCGAGTGACKSICDGAGTCGFPGYDTLCGPCTFCNSKGQCSDSRPDCVTSTGGTTGTITMPNKGGNTASSSMGKGGDTGSSSPGKGGNTGSSSTGSGGMGGGSGAGGAGGITTSGKGGSSSSSPGAAGSGGISTGSSGSAGTGGNSASSGGTVQGGSSGTSASSGSSGRPDGGGGSSGMDAGSVTRVGHSGCSCTVGRVQPSSTGWFPPLALVGAASLARWLRRRRKARIHLRTQGAGR